MHIRGRFSNSFKQFFFPPNNLVQSPSLRTDLYLQILTAKDNLSSTMGVISGGFVCEDSNFFFLRDKHKWITIMTRQIGKIRYFFLKLRPCCISPSSLVESQLAVLMHSWWLMTGVLSDHGILMATYPWLSKADCRKAAGSCCSSRLSAKWTAFCRQLLTFSQVSLWLVSFSSNWTTYYILI